MTEVFCVSPCRRWNKNWDLERKRARLAKAAECSQEELGCMDIEVAT